MMKLKKWISLTMAVLLLFSLFLMPVQAADADDGCITVEYNGVTFIFEEGTSEELQQRVIMAYFGIDSGSSTYGLTCTLFGHDLKAVSSIVVKHKVYSSAPRCERQYLVTYVCSRCDYASATQVTDTERIYCC